MVDDIAAHCSRVRLPRLAPAGFVLALALIAAPGRAGAEPSLFGSIPDPRTAGELPPALAAPAEPLYPSLETPGGEAWVRGEVPSGVADPHNALHGASATAGIRLPLVMTTGFSWTLKPTLTGSASAAAHPEELVVSPGIGVALGQAVSLSLPFGLKLGAEGTVGDRLGVGGVSSMPASSALAMRAGLTLSTDLALPFLETPMRIGLGVTTAGPLPGYATTAAYWRDAPDCAVSLEIAEVGGSPLRISSRCPGATGTGAVPPITFGFKREF